MGLLSIVGLVPSFILAIEKIHLLEDPEAQLSCSINPVYSCQNVILSDQASVFGFSNEFIGIAFFGGFLALSLVLVSGGRFAQWLHQLAWLGLAGSMGFVIWFFYQSVYNINALCMYCSIVWFATWTLFIVYSRYLLTEKIVKPPKRYASLTRMFIHLAPVVWIGLIIVFAGLILNHFWYYYGQYF